MPSVVDKEKEQQQQYSDNSLPIYEETVQEIVAQQCKNNNNNRNGTTTIVRVKSKTYVVSRSGSKNHMKTKTEQSFLDIVFELIGLRDSATSAIDGENTTKELGTLILLGVMFIVFIISVTGFFVMWFTEYYDNVMLSKIILAKDSETAERWMNPQPKYDTHLKIHIFNYTNMPEYLAGREQKIKVQDLGPLTYQEHTTRVNVSFNSNHTVTFRDHRSYKFLPEKSSFGEHDRVHVPNVPLLTAAVKLDAMGFLKRLYAGSIIRALRENPFKTLTAHELLWGYRDSIISMDFASGKTHFGLLINRNGTSIDTLQLNTGEDDVRKYSLITQFNGQPMLDYWDDGECNRIDGSDPSMFSPHMVETREDLQVFLQVLCRKVPLRFMEATNILENIEVLRYRMPANVFGNPSMNEANQCYCRNTQQCLPSGVINATKCFSGAPIFPSLPHFYNGDAALYEQFEGLAPIEAEHQTYADIHPRFAFPISGALRIQINIMAHKNDVTRDKLRLLPEGTILPLMWIEITAGDFSDDIVDMLYISTVGLNAIQRVLKYGTLLVCITSFGLIVASFYCLNRRREEQLMKNALHLATITHNGQIG